MNAVLIVIGISVLGPVLGSFIGILKKPSETFVYNLLSFAAGVMLSISFLELIPQSIELSSEYICIIGIIIGAFFMFLIDKIIPHIHPQLNEQEQGCNLKKTANYLLIGIFLHNFPEGMAMAVGTITNLNLSFTIAIAIAIHDIPEGIATSAPYYASTGKRLKAFLLSSSTAIPTVLGFLIAYYIFKTIPSNITGLITATTAGLMIYISADELIPSSCFKLTNHSTIFTFILGVISVVLLGLL